MTPDHLVYRLQRCWRSALESTNFEWELPSTQGCRGRSAERRKAESRGDARVSGCKIFKAEDLPESNSSGYPAPFRDAQRKRWNRRLGDYGGLKNYGATFVRVEPGGQSSARHLRGIPGGYWGRPPLSESVGQRCCFPGRGRPHARRRG